MSGGVDPAASRGAARVFVCQMLGAVERMRPWCLPEEQKRCHDKYILPRNIIDTVSIAHGVRRSAARSKKARTRLTITSPNAANFLEELLARCAVQGVQLGEWRRPRVHNKGGTDPRSVAEWSREAWSSEEEIGQTKGEERR